MFYWIEETAKIQSFPSGLTVDLSYLLSSKDSYLVHAASQLQEGPRWPLEGERVLSSIPLRKAAAKFSWNRTKLLKEKGPVWFQPYDNLEKAPKLWQRWKDQWSTGATGREGWLGEAQEFWGHCNYSVCNVMVDTCHDIFVKIHEIFNSKSGL